MEYFGVNPRRHARQVERAARRLERDDPSAAQYLRSNPGEYQTGFRSMAMRNARSFSENSQRLQDAIGASSTSPQGRLHPFTGYNAPGERMFGRGMRTMFDRYNRMAQQAPMDQRQDVSNFLRERFGQMLMSRAGHQDARRHMGRRRM